MIMVSFPFDSKITGYDSDNYPIYDRAVDSSTLSTMINEFVSTGVFPKEQDGFTVTAGDGMTVNVSPGSAIIKGTTCIEKDARTLTIQAADSTYDRIDSVILRYDNNENVRAIDLYVLKGTAASAPVQPTLTRNDAIFEIALANIYIPVNSTTISDERITDTRADTTRCGWATGVAQDFMQSINTRFEAVNASIASLAESTRIKYLHTELGSSQLFGFYNSGSGLTIEYYSPSYPDNPTIFSGKDTINNDDGRGFVMFRCRGYVNIPEITKNNRIINICIYDTAYRTSKQYKIYGNTQPRFYQNTSANANYTIFIEFFVFLRNVTTDPGSILDIDLDVFYQ